MTQCFPKIGFDVRKMIRLTEQDLRRVFQVGSSLLEDFYPEQVFSRMTKQEVRDFWDKMRIIPNNWIELCAYLLKEEFHDDFTIPLTQTDHSFLLQV